MRKAISYLTASNYGKLAAIMRFPSKAVVKADFTTKMVGPSRGCVLLTLKFLFVASSEAPRLGNYLILYISRSDSDQGERRTT